MRTSDVWVAVGIVAAMIVTASALGHWQSHWIACEAEHGVLARTMTGWACVAPVEERRENAPVMDEVRVSNGGTGLVVPDCNGYLPPIDLATRKPVWNCALTEFVPDLPRRMRLNRFVTSANFDEVWMQAAYRAESGSAPETYVGDPYSCNPASDIAMGVNGTSYRCNHRTKRWEVDTDAIAAENREEKHKRKLAWALQSRVLTDAEMGEVADLGINLFTSDMVPYQETEVQKTLNEALLQQSRLRSSARRQ